MRPVPLVRRRLAFSPQLSVRPVRVCERKGAGLARTLAHLGVRIAARAALLLLQVPGAATTTHAKGVGLVVPLTEALGTLRLCSAEGEQDDSEDIPPTTQPETTEAKEDWIAEQVRRVPWWTMDQGAIEKDKPAPSAVFRPGPLKPEGARFFPGSRAEAGGS